MWELHYSNGKIIHLEDLEKEYELENPQQKIKYNPFHIKNIQQYNPIYSLFFEMNSTNYNSICLKHPYHMVNTNSIYDEVNNVILRNQKIHIKYAPLLDPIHYLIGKYEKEGDKIRVLPDINLGSNGLPKITNYNNSAYIDCFFSFLSSQLYFHHGFQNGIPFYGSYLGIQEKYKMDVSDDYEYLQDSDFFNCKKVNYELECNGILHPNGSLSSFQNKKPKLILGEDIIDLPLSDIDIDLLPTSSEPNVSAESNTNDNMMCSEIELVYENTREESQSDASDSIIDHSVDESSENSNSSNSIVEHSSEEDEEVDDNNQSVVSGESDSESKIKSDNDESVWSDIDSSEDGSTEEDEPEPQVFCYMHDFPVQMICLEKCDGTLDSLLEMNILEDIQIVSALFQIVITLSVYQKTYQFTHNDLHTNNIVYISTPYEYIYYTYQQTIYKVPTFGRLFKIIDFGRSIYKFQDKLFCSDSFSLSGDANTQYNFGPFYNDKKPVIEPNPSFDLCRLGCSLYDFVFEMEEEYIIRQNKNKWTDLQKLIAAWCMDDFNKNILYKKSGDDRYPNFKLYKMIARTVHGAIPEKQLQNPIFSQFEVDSSVKTEDTNPKSKKHKKSMDIDLDSIPKYFI